jgi:hypothetical protein
MGRARRFRRPALSSRTICVRPRRQSPSRSAGALIADKMFAPMSAQRTASRCSHRGQDVCAHVGTTSALHNYVAHSIENARAQALAILAARRAPRSPTSPRRGSSSSPFYISLGAFATARALGAVWSGAPVAHRRSRPQLDKRLSITGHRAVTRSAPIKRALQAPTWAHRSGLRAHVCCRPPSSSSSRPRAHAAQDCAPTWATVIESRHAGTSHRRRAFSSPKGMSAHVGSRPQSRHRAHAHAGSRIEVPRTSHPAAQRFSVVVIFLRRSSAGLAASAFCAASCLALAAASADLAAASFAFASLD